MTSNAEPTSIRVELADRAYDIFIGENLLSNASTYLAPVLARPRIVIITDKTVSSLHLAPLRASLDGAGIQNDVIVVSPGEATKNFAQLQGVLNRLLDLRVERKDTILALGGGVVGDLAGFAAAILHRGVNFVQVPTTLLAQVDSSVGGKTAINAAQGKNLIGAFYQPKMVLSDVATLDSLPTRELRAGYGEVVKYGLIDDFPFFEWLEEHGSDVLSGDRAALCHAIAVSCRSKADIVARDEREGG
nr:3-dehydroquinate synthase [Alphaproteobacteria bacterium]